MFAVIKTGGKQYRVAAEDVITIATLAGEPGAAVTFDQVLMVTNDGGTQVGAPVVAGVTVTGEVVEHTRGDEGHRLQEAPPPEFAPQARASPGLHRGADHRDPRRRRQAQDGCGAAEDHQGCGRRRCAGRRRP